MPKISQSEIVRQISEKTNLTQKETDSFINDFFEVIKENLATGNDVSFVGFGAFFVNNRPAREGRNPKTGEKIQIEAKNVVKFKAGKGLNDGVNG